jgi:cell division inhibitor SepF
MDLSDADGDLARRLIDFSSGLCYGIGGTMQRLERSSVYLILPVGVDVPEQERALLLGSTDEDL